MYGLKGTTDLRFLAGRKLEQLRLGAFEVQFLFDADVMLSVQSRMTFEHGNASEPIASDQPEQAKNMWPLIGATVSEYTISVSGDLVVSFGNGFSLTVHDSNPNFESYVIWNKGDFIAV